MTSSGAPNNSPDDDFSAYLTPELVSLFERQGYDLVERQVFARVYSSGEKQKAAIFWLQQRRSRERRRDNFWKTIAVIGPVIAAFGGAYLGASINAKTSWSIHAEQMRRERTALVASLIADVSSLLDEEKERHQKLAPELDRLIRVEACNKKVSGIPRPWLMPAVPTQFPVFDQMAIKLGTLPSSLAADVVRFYGTAAMLRNQINLVIGPPILCASRTERESAVAEYSRALEHWRNMGGVLLNELSSANNL